MKIRLWKCRSVESVENQDQVSLSSHRPWKSLRDSHIPIASTTASLFTTKERTSDTTPYSSGSSFNEKMLRYTSDRWPNRDDLERIIGRTINHAIVANSQSKTSSSCTMQRSR